MSARVSDNKNCTSLIDSTETIPESKINISQGKVGKKIKEYMKLRDSNQTVIPRCYGYCLLFGYYHFLNKGHLFFDRLRECLSIDMKEWGSLSEKTFREMSKDQIKMESLYNDLNFLFRQQFNGFTSSIVENLQFVSPKISLQKISKPFKFSIILPQSKSNRMKSIFVETVEKIISIALNTPTFIFIAISTGVYHTAALYYDGDHLSFYDPNIPNQVKKSSPEKRKQREGKIAEFFVKKYMKKKQDFVALELFPMMKNPSLERLVALEEAYKHFNMGIGQITKDELYIRFETAVMAGDLKDLVYWMERGKEIGSVCDIGTTLLNVAIQKGQIEIGKFLIGNGVDVNGLDTQGNAPLHYAALEGSREFAELLLQKGALVNIKNTRGETTALIVSSQNGDEKMVNLLIKHRADVEIKDNENIFPLWIASQNGHLSIVKRLLESGAESDLIGAIGLKPYEVAEINDHHEIKKVLLDHARGD